MQHRCLQHFTTSLDQSPYAAWRRNQGSEEWTAKGDQYGSMINAFVVLLVVKQDLPIIGQIVNL